MWRIFAGSITRATCSRTTGNIPRRPVWNRSGSSSFTRKWLNSRLISGTKTDTRYTSGAISVVLITTHHTHILRTKMCYGSGSSARVDRSHFGGRLRDAHGRHRPGAGGGVPDGMAARGSAISGE